MTHAGPTKRRAGIVSQAFSGRILARHPMNRRIEVRAGVLAEASACSSTTPDLCRRIRDDVDRHAGRCGEHRRQADDRRLAAERLRQIDDRQRPAVERCR
jgi:hypothetical protein